MLLRAAPCQLEISGRLFVIKRKNCVRLRKFQCSGSAWRVRGRTRSRVGCKAEGADRGTARRTAGCACGCAAVRQSGSAQSSVAKAACEALTAAGGNGPIFTGVYFHECASRNPTTVVNFSSCASIPTTSSLRCVCRSGNYS